MSQLDSGDGTLFTNERRNPLERLNLRIVPQSEVVRRNAAVRRHGRRLCDYRTRAADRATAEMDEMPVVRYAARA